MANVLIVDETTAGDRTPGILVEVNGDLRVRDIISLRVREEVRRYNVERLDGFSGLVQPTDLEAQFNRTKPREHRPIDADTQVQVALRAFEVGRFMMILPTGQATTLDQPVRLKEGDEVTFIRLLPLVGG